MKNHAISELPAAQVQTGRLTACGIAFLIGIALVFLVGFAHPAVLHNAAHDSRHALAFPCH
jgi:cobalt transporter subunit CbtB